MHIYNLDNWRHSHNFNPDSSAEERQTRRVVALTVVMMAAEIGAGVAFGSMALLADGWHMATHAFALGITLFAYRYARLHSKNPAYTFGTGKVGALGGYTSAVVLAVIALLMMAESLQRLFAPVAIRFTEAITVAVLGLAVNIASAFLLQGAHGHDHAGHHDHDHDHHHDHNLRAAYFHVLADAMTSVLAIVALLAGKVLGWAWMDPLMGIVGGLVITKWASTLLKDSSAILLDKSPDQRRQAEIRAAIEADADNRVTDLHIWPIGSHHFAAILSVVTHFPQPAPYYKDLLRDFAELEHITVEVIHCLDEPCVPVPGQTVP